MITQTAEALNIASRRSGQTEMLMYSLDGLVQSLVQDTRVLPTGTRLSGENTQSYWDAAKLVTLKQPFSIWTPSTGEPSRVPTMSDIVVVRTLGAGGNELTVERVSRHTPGWAFTGKEPSQTYLRIKDVYIKSAP